ncbi:MAG: prolyl oligopeptidase family serine peptidase, partial [Bacteroidota bacterium]
APDAITFEDRRANRTGNEPDPEDEADWLQHYNGSAYRLITGDTLMRKGLDDAQRAVSVLLQEPRVDPERVGVGGHSYGGTTALYTAAVDSRCRFACVSGALCSLEARMRNGTGINLFELVPGLASLLSYADLLRAIAPRPTFVVSATRDRYAQDANEVVARAGVDTVTELRVNGEHALDPARHQAIVDWLVTQASS